MKEFLSDYLSELNYCLGSINSDKLAEVRDILLTARDDGRTIFVIGNGGSASTASHVSNDWSKGVLGHTGEKNIKRFRVISLTDNVATMTAWANDTSFDDIFSQQLENLVQEGDVLLAISASGNSKNILNALNVAEKHGAMIVGLAGFDGGELAKRSKVCITAEIKKYDVAEDFHMIVTHMLTRWFYENLK
ncbi:MAG: SIS domain-containing protein [Candidatus Berkelbacteria bacterium]